MTTWTARVAQEFVFNAATADEALAFVRKLAERQEEGAVLVDHQAALAPFGKGQAPNLAGPSRPGEET